MRWVYIRTSYKYFYSVVANFFRLRSLGILRFIVLIFTRLLLFFVVIVVDFSFYFSGFGRGVAESGEAEQALSPAYLGVIYDNIEVRD